MTAVFAHRGFAKGAKENTIEAFLAASDAGADWVELDVRRTRDGVLVAHHDAHLEDGRVIVELAADELPDGLPTLAEIFESCADIGVDIEIKNSPGDPDYDENDMVAVAVTGLVQAYRSPDDVLVTSFNPASITRIQEIDPSIPVGVVAFDALDPVQLVERAAERRHAAINPWVGLTNVRLVERAHQCGLKVNVWTVNDDAVIERMLDLGVDGIITDRVDLVRRAVDRR